MVSEQTVLPFQGTDYVAERDAPRLRNQARRVFMAMRDREWRSYDEIQRRIEARFDTRDPIQSIARQLRYLRQPEWGGYVVQRRYEGNGLYKYRVLEPGHPDVVDPEDVEVRDG